MSKLPKDAVVGKSSFTHIFLAYYEQGWIYIEDA